VCDVKQLVSFLQGNADKAAAWAKVIGITLGEIPSYIDDLTSVILRSDTRVTNHGFAGGAATNLQSVLQAGTAVLIDKFGVRACVATAATAHLTGAGHSHLRGPDVVRLRSRTGHGDRASPTPIINIVLINIVDGTTFQRPVGTDGGSNVKVTLVPKGGTSSTTTTTPQSSSSTTTTQGSAGTTQAAIKIIHDGLAKCVADLKAQGQVPNETNVDVFKYSADPLGGVPST